jgi:H+/Cl- antiporter ClcA
VPKSNFKRTLAEQFRILLDLARWLPIAGVVGALAGSASALLIASLNLATNLREAHHWLILLLGPAGFFVGCLYHYLGRSVEAGHNLILEEIHDPKAVIPLRMTSLILIGTFLTHVFGGSAGREGTALQTGASLADQLTRPLRLSPRDRRILLMAGLSAGFGSVFGTPLAGAVFGLEVLALGSISYDAIAPCFIAAVAGDLVTKAWGIHHEIYSVANIPTLHASGIVYSVAAGIVFGLVAMAFAKTAHAISHASASFISFAPLRPLVGGIIITCGILLVGTKYIGLGLPTIAASFHGKVPAYDFAGKFLFTTFTLGTNFKGGEVTPLFFIGSTLGNALSHIIPLPTPLLAAMGFAAVFAGAANTPIASTLLAMELFGAEVGAYAGIACVISYLFSGHSGIYQAQRVGRSKHRRTASEEETSLASIAQSHAHPGRGSG